MIRATSTAALAALLLGFAAPAAVAAASTNAASDAPAWSLVAADNEHGTGRGNYGYELDPGSVIVDALVINNTGREPLELALYAADAFTTPDGVLDLRLADEPKADAGSWITFDTDSVSIEPGRSVEVPFTVTVPADASPGDHPGGIVTSSLSTQAGATLAVDRRLGIRVHLRVSGDLHPAVGITDVETVFTPSWNPFDGGTLTVSYTLVNTGDTRITASDAVALAGPFGVGAATASPQATAEVLPGSSVVVTREHGGIAPLGWIGGTLTVAPAAVGLGAAALEAVSVEVGAGTISWMLVAVVVVLLTAVAGILVFVRRRAGSHAAA